jgi:uncharacterized protein with NAD-binding domain and iron-sulfur cluster
MTASRPDIAVLGGGMAGLAAAWRLTDPLHRDRVGQVTIYQRGWRLGGKAASHRGVHDRIEEHGLHIWLGYYDNAFRMIRECYAELDRSTTDPASPIREWDDAFAPAPLIGLEDLHEGDWRTWTAWFPTNDLLPGEPIDEGNAAVPPTAAEFLGRSLGLMQAFVTSLDGTAVDLVPAVALAAGREAHRLLDRLAAVIPIAEVPRRTIAALNAALQPMVQDRDGSRRLWHLADLIAAQLRGLLADDLLKEGFHSIDHIEYRDWISAHGASPETCRGALVRGLYDLAFSHRAGDPSDTAFPAGLGLLLSTKTFFDYRGSLFWKMTAGMGDTVIAPLYQALRRRGVRFEFFHRVDDVVASEDGTALERIHLGRQVRLVPGLAEYQPLQRYGGLDCFPAKPLADQLDAPASVRDAPLESFWCTWPDADSVVLERGRDFDEVVFAIPVGMAAHVTSDLAGRSDKWRDMLSTLETIGTQGAHLWLRRSEAELGSPGTGSTVTSYVDSFDTFSSMSHLLPRESWPADDQPASVVYLCSSMSYGEVDDPADGDQPARARRRVHADALAYLRDHIAHYLPNSVGADGFEWDLLCGAPPGSGPEALDAQYLVANVDPSDRYVQAIPGTGHVRLAPDGSGFRHMHLAGDWTDNGLNAGCIEAAVMSGIQSANSVLGISRWSGVTGEWR